MGRCFKVLIGLLGATLLASGCAAPQIRNPFAATEARKPAVKPTEKVAGKSKPKGESIAAKADGKGAGKGSTGAPGTDANAARTPGGDAASRTGRNSTAQDPETLALIERELRDATPEERASLTAELKQVHPDMVRQILRYRRMGLKYQQQQLAAVAGNDVQVASAQRPLSGSTQQSEADTVRNLVSAGLGPATPWGATDQKGSLQPRINLASAPAAALAATAARDPGSVQPFPSAAPVANGAVAGANPNPVAAANSLVQIGFGEQVPPGQNPAIAVAAPTANHPAAAAGQAPAAPGANPAVGVEQKLAAAPPAGSPVGPGVAQAAPGIAPVAPGVTQVAAVQPPGNAIPPAATASQSTIPASGLPGSAPVAPADPWIEHLQEVVDLTAAEAAQMRPGTTEPEKQAYIEKQVYLRMLYLMAGQQERALQAIPGLEPADQEFWQQTFWGIANYFDAKAIPAGSDRASQTVAQLTTAILRLQEKANLELRNVTFCHKISSFGNYDRFPRDEFSPGQPILLYAEVGNFHSEPTTDGQYRTILKSTIEIHKPGPRGELVDSIAFPATEDVCRNHRRDYFHSYEYTVPPKISLGPHVLKLIVEDQLSRKIATYTLNFTVK